MDSEEKKFSLEELPDEGSSSVSEAPPAKKVDVKSAPDPRKELIAKVAPKEKIRVMEQSWKFDKKEYLFGWVIYVGLLCAAQVYVKAPGVAEDWARLDNLLDGNLSFIGSFVLNPVVFIFLTPFFFNFREESPHYFEVSFEGISTMKKVYPEKGEFPTRLLVKWGEIDNVKRTKSRERDILLLESKNGVMAQLIWDVDEEKKRGLKHLLKSLVPVNHSLRKFLEKDLP